jgi:hypothetical protein
VIRGRRRVYRVAAQGRGHEDRGHEGCASGAAKYDPSPRRAMTGRDTSQLTSVDRLLVALQRRLPQHSAGRLRQFVRMAQIGAREAGELAGFLDRHEDALTRSRSAVPAAFPSLAHVLSVSAGVIVAKPTCAGCGRATFFLQTRRRKVGGVPPARPGSDRARDAAVSVRPGRSPRTATSVRRACGGRVGRRVRSAAKCAGSGPAGRVARSETAVASR